MGQSNGVLLKEVSAFPEVSFLRGFTVCVCELRQRVYYTDVCI